MGQIHSPSAFHSAQEAFIVLFDFINNYGHEIRGCKRYLNLGFYTQAPEENVFKIEWLKAKTVEPELPLNLEGIEKDGALCACLHLSSLNLYDGFEALQREASESLEILAADAGLKMGWIYYSFNEIVLSDSDQRAKARYYNMVKG